ncbi:endonuclease domain-containing protein [Hymenobacter sp. APR13]|uniref:endonuclease domain-containing protein n=1 Tax=Hymenobacter sp. APR13 TaxID=1356852 RepID=UPI001E342BE0|nr:DUF559 domain-containing protein [Hymenobacter sp. APR13]
MDRRNEPDETPHPPAPSPKKERGSQTMDRSEVVLPQEKAFTTDKRQYGKLSLKDRSRAMRHAPTEAEEALWQLVRGNALGAKFRRQHSIDRYIVDFVSLRHKLILEVDGEGHYQPDQQDYDAGRTALLAELGYRLLRFSNAQVLTQPRRTIATIKLHLTSTAQ